MGWGSTKTTLLFSLEGPGPREMIPRVLLGMVVTAGMRARGVLNLFVAEFLSGIVVSSGVLTRVDKN